MNYQKNLRKAIATFADCSISDLESEGWHPYSAVFSLDGTDRKFEAIDASDIDYYIEDQMNKTKLKDNPDFWTAYCDTYNQGKRVAWFDLCADALFDIAYDYLENEFEERCIERGVAEKKDFEPGGKYADPEDWETLGLYNEWVAAELDYIGEIDDEDYLKSYMLMCNQSWADLLKTYGSDYFNIDALITDYLFKDDDFSSWCEWVGAIASTYYDKYNCYVVEY